LSITFSEPLAAPPTVSTVTESGGSNSSVDSLVLSGIFSAAAPFNVNDYITNGNKDAAIPSTSGYSGSTLVLTLGSYTCNPGNCGVLGMGSAGTLTYTQVGTLADAAGNTLASTGTSITAQTINLRAF
jgi:hypothetical protein